MARKRLLVDLYCEDRGHELFVDPLLQRLASEEGVDIDTRLRSGRGGHGRAVTEFKAWQRLAQRGHVDRRPDLLVLVIDGNCQEWSKAHAHLVGVIDESIFPRSVVGCPEPHVERWCIADPESFKDVVGGVPKADPGKCERQIYKDLLRQSILSAEQPILTNEMEFAPDLVKAMDFYRAGKNKNQRSLRLFVEDVRKALRTST